MRKCIFKTWERKTGYSDPIDGLFHGFGKKIIEHETGIAEETIAIVESEKSGKLCRVDVETVIFKDKPNV